MIRYYYRRFKFINGAAYHCSRSRTSCNYYFFSYLQANSCFSGRANQQFVREKQIPLTYIRRSASRNYCSVSGFPRAISANLLFFSRHEFNRRVVRGSIAGFRKC